MLRTSVVCSLGLELCKETVSDKPADCGPFRGAILRQRDGVMVLARQVGKPSR